MKWYAQHERLSVKCLVAFWQLLCGFCYVEKLAKILFTRSTRFLNVLKRSVIENPRQSLTTKGKERNEFTRRFLLEFVTITS